MSDLPKRIKIKEVGPREGFQFEKGAISLADKISPVDALSDTEVSGHAAAPPDVRGGGH